MRSSLNDARRGARGVDADHGGVARDPVRARVAALGAVKAPQGRPRPRRRRSAWSSSPPPAAAPLDAALATMSLAIVLLACAAVLARV